MSDAGLLDAMERGWNSKPFGVAAGTARTAISSALWTRDSDVAAEVSCSPQPATHIIAVQYRTFHAEMFINGRQVDAGLYHAGDLTIVRAGEHPRAIQRGRFRCLHIYVPDALISDLAAEEVGSRAELVATHRRHDPLLARIGQQFLLGMQQDFPFARVRMDALGLQVAAHMLGCYSNLRGATTRARRATTLAPWQVRRATEALADLESSTLSLEKLAGLVGLSAAHFARAFRASTGLPPHAWAAQQRLQRAAERLAATAEPIAGIAVDMGYASQQGFTTAFKRHTGVTPAVWRRERQP